MSPLGTRRSIPPPAPTVTWHRRIGNRIRLSADHCPSYMLDMRICCSCVDCCITHYSRSGKDCWRGPFSFDQCCNQLWVYFVRQKQTICAFSHATYTNAPPLSALTRDAQTLRTKHRLSPSASLPGNNRLADSGSCRAAIGVAVGDADACAERRGATLAADRVSRHHRVPASCACARHRLHRW